MIVHWALMIAGIVLALPVAACMLIESVRSLKVRAGCAMSPQTVGIVGFLIMVALIFLRIPVAIALGLVGTVGYAVLNGWTQSLLVLSRVPLTLRVGL